LFTKYRLYGFLSLILVVFLSSGCATVNYVKDIDKSMKQLDKLNDRLQDARIEADASGFAETVEAMKKETDFINNLDPGLMKWKGSDEVLEKSQAIAALLDDIGEEAERERPDDKKLDKLLKKLSTEIDEVVE